MQDFPKINRNESGFKNNFLRTIILNIHLNENFDIDKNEGNIFQLFSNLYPRESRKPKNILSLKINSPLGKGVYSDSTESTLELKSKDGKKTINFSKREIQMEMSGDSYLGFEDLKNNEISWLDKLIKQFGIGVKLIQLKKVNLIGYEVTNGQEPLTIAERVFNNDLISNNTYIPSNQTTFKYKLDNLKYIYPEYSLNIKFGILSDTETTGRLVLDIDATSDNIKLIQESQIPERFTLLNDKIFDVFYWALNSEAKEILKQTQKT